MSTMNVCVTCKKEGILRCEGCDQYFCSEHLVEHRELLRNECDGIQNEFYMLQEELYAFQRENRGLGDCGGYDQQSIEEIIRKKDVITEKMNRTMEELRMCHIEKQCNETRLREMKHALSSQCSQWHEDLARLNEMTGNHGVPFVDLSDTNGYKIVLWSISAPEWRRAVRGMCLEGFCENEKCEAYRQRVIIGIGMREFDLLADPSPSTTPCPMCKQYVEPTTCGFNNCQWRWQGIKQMPRQPPMPLFGDWKQVDNAYHYFDQTIKGTATTSGTCIWRQLKIEAKNLP